MTGMPLGGQILQGGRAHVIGAGLAGLAAATRLARAGVHVRLYEAAQAAGGRCRSYDDAELGCRVDNGNHLLVSGNAAAMAYVNETQAGATFVTQEMAEFPFLDIRSGERWSVSTASAVTAPEASAARTAGRSRS